MELKNGNDIINADEETKQNPKTTIGTEEENFQPETPHIGKALGTH
jgi:hypothetical protein